MLYHNVKSSCSCCGEQTDHLYLVRLLSKMGLKLNPELPLYYDSDLEFDYVTRYGLICKKCVEKIFREYMASKKASTFCKLEIL